MDLEEQFATCRSMDVAAIAATFEDVEQDDVTRALLSIFAKRTRTDRLPELPYRVGFTMYGDADVPEWVVEHTADGSTVQPTADGGDVDLDTRWEHWEDGVRLVNGDLPGLALYYARRITMGDEPTTDNEPPWLRAVDFAPGSAALAQNRILTELIEANERGAKALEAHVQAVGLQRVAEARGLTVAQALLESGCAEHLKGSFMALTIADEPSVLAVADIGDTVVTAGDEATASGPAGVVLRYATRHALIDGATGTRTFQDLLVNGLVKVEGDEESRGRFARTLMDFARLHGI